MFVIGGTGVGGNAFSIALEMEAGKESMACK